MNASASQKSSRFPISRVFAIFAPTRKRRVNMNASRMRNPVSAHRTVGALTTAVAAFGCLLWCVQPAVAFETTSAGCIQDVWKAHNNTQSLNCSANDVNIARVTDICVLTDPADPTSCKLNGDGSRDNSCTADSDVTFSATFEVKLTAQTRYDIGLYLATDGGNGDGALTGDCQLDTLDGNSRNYTTADNDTCGDIKNTTASNPQLVDLTVTTKCTGNADSKLLLPNCTSWRQPGSNEFCDDATDAFPGAPSKCHCDSSFAIDITVEKADATVTKTAKEACVSYEVKVSNPTTTRTLSLSALSDDKYGDITSTGNANLCSTTCGQADGAGVLPTTISAGGTYTCTFAAKTVSTGPGTLSGDQVCYPQTAITTDTVTATVLGDGDTTPTQPQGLESVLVDLTAPTP